MRAPETGSWHQREVARALQRLANARANVAVLEQQVAQAAPLGPPIAPVEVRALERIHEQIERTRAQAAGPYGGHTLRVRLVELQTAMHERLEQLGLSTYDDLVSLVAAHERRETDRVALQVARSEVAAAEAHFIEVATMDDPEPQLAIPAATGSAAPAIDLTAEPAYAYDDEPDVYAEDYDEAAYAYAEGDYAGDYGTGEHDEAWVEGTWAEGAYEDEQQDEATEAYEPEYAYDEYGYQYVWDVATESWLLCEDDEDDTSTVIDLDEYEARRRFAAG